MGINKRPATRYIKAILSLLLCVTIFFANAQSRFVQTINSNWLFYKGVVADINNLKTTGTGWQKINLPHSWNITDVLDDEPGYYRGIGSYSKTIYIPASWKSKRIYLSFEGANQVAEIYVNGKKAGSHTGGYTAFNCDITAYLKFDNTGNSGNEVLIVVDNSHNDNIPPFSADFTFFGGIYRDVHLIATEPLHFSMNDNASCGVYITTPQVSEQKALVSVKGFFTNNTKGNKKVKITSQVLDRNGKAIAQKDTIVNSKANETTQFTQQIKDIRQPALWSPEKPVLYKVVSTLTDVATNQQSDCIINPLGFRSFSFDAQNGFFLNGKPYKLIGTNRHQDYKDIANALPDAMHENDMKLLKDMGGNFIRISHYPQDPAVLQACDRLGLLASVEIPVVNRITESAEFAANCKNMQVEMIRQNYNHPSVIIWAYMNEILLRPLYEDDKPRQETYFKSIAKLAQDLDSLTRKEDPYRYTMAAMNGKFDLYMRTGLANIPMITGWNLYQGWYSETVDKFGEYLDNAHKQLPGKPIIVTEYGADALSQLRTFEPVRFDKTIEYGNYYHRVYFEEIMKRPFVAGSCVWNLADFNSESRIEAMPHINNKGLLTIERIPKDVYYYYQSRLLKQPFIRIASGNWKLRSGIAAGSDKQYCIQPVEVYSNRDKVALLLNGKQLAVAQTVKGIAKFDVPFINGYNQLEAVNAENNVAVKDNATIEFLLIPFALNDTSNPFKEINISLGDKRYYTDEKLHQVWLPEKQYEKNSWGYIGGQPFTIKGSRRISYGSDKNILGTDYDAIYETQREGIEAFRLDVSDGLYEITLHFCELLSGVESEKLAYNLDNTADKEKQGERAFNIYINGQKVMEQLGNRQYLQPAYAVSFRYNAIASGNSGIEIKFERIVGEPILNALQVKKIF